MYGHFNRSFYDNNSTGYLSQSHPSHFSPLLSQSNTNGDFDSIAQPGNGNGSSNSGTSSSYVGSPSSPPSCCTSSHPLVSANNMIQRSLSSHSFHKNGLYPPVSSPSGLPDLDISQVRRVFSTGDLDKVILNNDRGNGAVMLKNYCMIKQFRKVFFFYLINFKKLKVDVSDLNRSLCP